MGEIKLMPCPFCGNSVAPAAADVPEGLDEAINYAARQPVGQLRIFTGRAGLPGAGQRSYEMQPLPPAMNLPDGITDLYAAPAVPEDMRRDAERYRFIRDADRSDPIISYDDLLMWAGKALDNAIDAAMAAQPQGEGVGRG